MELLIFAALLLIYGHLSGSELAKDTGEGILIGFFALAALLAVGVIAFLLLT